MNEWNDQALVLRYGLFHEYDLWLNVLCRERGLCTLFAFGGAKSKKRFCGCIDVLNSLQCRVEESRNGAYYNLREAVLLKGTRKLRTDWQTMGMAANCIRFLRSLDISPENAPESYGLVEDLREMLENSPRPPGLTPFFFRLKLASLLGFSPDFRNCGTCGKLNPREGFFVPADGRIYCLECLPSHVFSGNAHPRRFSGSVLETLRKSMGESPLQWSEKNLSSLEIRTCAACADEFAKYHLGVDWDNGDFRHV